MQWAAHGEGRGERLGEQFPQARAASACSLPRRAALHLWDLARAPRTAALSGRMAIALPVRSWMQTKQSRRADTCSLPRETQRESPRRERESASMCIFSRNPDTLVRYRSRLMLGEHRKADFPWQMSVPPIRRPLQCSHGVRVNNLNARAH